MIDQLYSLIHQLIESHPIGAPVIFVASHIAFAVFLLPCSPLTLLAGAFWGGLNGFALSFLGAFLSTIVTFVLSRAIFRSRLRAIMTKRYPAVCSRLKTMGDRDLMLVAATYINPALPSSAAGYFFGLTDMSFQRFMILSAIFMLPLQSLFVLTGYSAGSLAIQGGPIWLGVSALLVGSVVFCVPIIARKLHKRLGMGE